MKGSINKQHCGHVHNLSSCENYLFKLDLFSGFLFAAALVVYLSVQNIWKLHGTDITVHCLHVQGHGTLFTVYFRVFSGTTLCPVLL